jgi:hypothetical protein
MDVDYGERQGQVSDLTFSRQRRLLFLGETDIGRRATDVDRDTAREASLTRHRNGPHDGRGRT